jgi:hypothetical protein
MPGVWLASAADCLRIKRSQLLRHVSDRRSAARRPLALETLARRLATHARGARTTAAAMKTFRERLPYVCSIARWGLTSATRRRYGGLEPFYPLSSVAARTVARPATPPALLGGAAAPGRAGGRRPVRGVRAKRVNRVWRRGDRSRQRFATGARVSWLPKRFLAGLRMTQGEGVIVSTGAGRRDFPRRRTGRRSRLAR